MSALQRAAKSVATRAGAPPAALTRGALAPFEVVVVGGPDNLARRRPRRAPVVHRGARRRRDLRSGSAAVGPVSWTLDRRRRLSTPRMLEIAGAAGPGLLASELLILPAAFRRPHGARRRQRTDPVVFSARRGRRRRDRVSGALDAWRHRAGRSTLSRGSGAQASRDRMRRGGSASAIAVARPRGAGHRRARAPAERERRPASRRPISPAGDRARACRIGHRVAASRRERRSGGSDPALADGRARRLRRGVARPAPVRTTSPSRRAMRAATSRCPSPRDVVTDRRRTPRALALVAARIRRTRVSDRQRAGAGRRDEARRIRRARVGRHRTRCVRRGGCVPFAGLLCAEWAVRRKRGLAMSQSPMRSTYLDYLRDVRRMSPNTISSYARDLARAGGLRRARRETVDVARSPRSRGVHAADDDQAASRRARSRARSPASAGFYKFLLIEKKIDADPAEDLRAPRAWPALPKYLDLEQVDRLLAQPDVGDAARACATRR